MKRFAMGLFTTLAALLTVNVYLEGWYQWYGAPEYLRALILYCGFPTVTTLAIVVLMQYRRPRRIFKSGSSRATTPYWLGLLAGVTAVLLSIPLVVFLDTLLSDPVLLCLATTAATLPLLLLCRRTIPGQCIRCTYDLRSSLGTGRCPECGLTMAELMAA